MTDQVHPDEAAKRLECSCCADWKKSVEQEVIQRDEDGTYVVISQESTGALYGLRFCPFCGAQKAGECPEHRYGKSEAREVKAAIEQYDRDVLPARVQQIMSDPRRHG